MNFVSSFDLFGVEAMQIPCIPGTGTPTSTTAGSVGCLYMDTGSKNKDLYKCVECTDKAYKWVKLQELSIDDAAMSTNTTWSSSKIQEVINTCISNSDILDATVE